MSNKLQVMWSACIFEDLQMFQANTGRRGGKSTTLIYQVSSKIQEWKKALIIYMMNNKSCSSEEVIMLLQF